MAVNSNQALIDKLVNLNGGCDIELDKSKITENLIQKKYETQLNSFIYSDERQAYLTQTRQFYTQGAGSDAINDYMNQFKQNYANYRQGIAKIKTSAVNITASNAIPAVITTGAATSVSNPAYTAIDNLQKLTALQSSLSVVINVVISMLSAAAALYLTLPKSLTDEINDLQDIKKDVDDAIDDANKNKEDNPWDPNDPNNGNNGENSNWKQIVELIDSEIDEAIRKALELQNEALEDMRKAIEAGRTKGQVISYSEYLAMQGQYDNNTVYVVKTDDGTTVLGQIIRGIYMPIPLSANAESVITLTQEEYDALESPNPYTLYVIVDENGTIVRMYLGGKELNQEGIIRSVITSMFSEKITLNEDNTKITSINWTMLNVDDPGSFYAQTGLENLVTNQILSSGFVSKADVDGAFAEVYAQIQDINTGKVNKAYVITEINASGESGVKIHADKIQITGNNSITAAVEFYDWLTGDVGDGKAGLDLKADREKAIADLASQIKTDTQTATANIVLYTSYDESLGVLTVQYKKDDATALASLYTSSTVDGALAGIRTDFSNSLTTAMAEVYTKSQVDNAIAGLRTEFNDGITAATSGLLSTKEGNLLYATKETTKINRFFGTGTGNGWTLSQPKTTATKTFAADTRLFTIDNYYPIGTTHLSSDAYTAEHYNVNLVSPAVEVDTEKYYVVSFNVKKDDRVDFWIQFAYATAASTAHMTVNDSQNVAFRSALADGATVVAGKAIRIKKYDDGDYYRYFIVFKPTQKYMRVYFVNQLHQDDITSTSKVTKDTIDKTLAWPYGSDTSDHITTEYRGSSDGKTLITTTTLHRYAGNPNQTYVKVTVKIDTAVSGKLYLMKLQLEEAANQTLTDIVPGEYKEDQVTMESYIQQTAEAITIKAQDIHLEGYTTINGGFSVDTKGNATMIDCIVKGNFYTPYTIIDSSNYMKYGYINVKDWVAPFYELSLDLAGLNVQIGIFDYSRTQFISLPTDEKYVGAELNLFCVGKFVGVRNVSVFDTDGFNSHRGWSTPSFKTLNPFIFCGQKVKFKCVKMYGVVRWFIDAKEDCYKKADFGNPIVYAVEFTYLNGGYRQAHGTLGYETCTVTTPSSRIIDVTLPSDLVYNEVSYIMVPWIRGSGDAITLKSVSGQKLEFYVTNAQLNFGFMVIDFSRTNYYL